MKPPRFAYCSPESVAEALALLAEHGSDAKILAGGQSLVPMLNMRLVRPALLVDVNRLQALGCIREEAGAIAIGALARQRAVERSDLVRRRCPLLAAATEHVAHFQIRNRGTIGGSLAHHDPAAELALAATVLEASLVLERRGARRVVRPADFFLTYFTTALAPDELLVQVQVPAMAPDTGWAFLEVSRRHGDFALVGAAVLLHLDAGGRVAWARIGLNGVGGAPVRAAAAETLLAGQRPDEAALAAAAAAAAAGLDPEPDIHASPAYRLHLARTLTRRALEQALARARRGDAA